RANRHQRLAESRAAELYQQFPIPGRFRGDTATGAGALAAVVRLLLALSQADFLQDLSSRALHEKCPANRGMRVCAGSAGPSGRGLPDRRRDRLGGVRRGHRYMRSIWLLISIWSIPAHAQNADTSFFETRIRPVLATKCYACHSSSLKAPMGGLLLDTK